MSTRKKRRASDSMGARMNRPPNAASAYIGGGLLLAFLVAWFAWQGWNRIGAVREGAPSWTHDGRIVFYSEVDGQADLFVMNADGTGRRPLLESDADEGAPSMSPDGQWLAYDTDVDGNYEIYVMDMVSEQKRRVTNHRGRDVSPAWHPTNGRLVFMSDRDSAPEFDTYSVNPDGSDLRKLSTEPSNWFPRFSPDGNRLAFHRGEDLYVMTLANGAVSRLTTTPQNGMHPTWSPNGDRLAFMTWRNGVTELFTMSAFGGEQ